MSEPARCRNHEVAIPCPLCAKAAWPTRDLKAVVDFAGKPIDNADGLVPEYRYIRLSEVVRRVGRRWAELERVKQTVLRPLYATKNTLVREARIGAIDVGRLEKAAAARARGEQRSEDPIVNLYLRAIIEDESAW